MSERKQQILINSTFSEEVRVAVTHRKGRNYLLDALDIQYKHKEQRVNDVCLGVITHIEKSLDAVFVNYGGDRHGFLPRKEIAPEYFLSEVDKDTPVDELNIQELLKTGQQILVQVKKEQRAEKGAALTSYVSLAGSYLVLMPNNPEAGGVSRRLTDEERNELRNAHNQLEIPEEMSVIIRTAGIGRTIEELKWDLDVLLKRWNEIKVACTRHNAPQLIYRENSVIHRTIRDYLRDNIEKIIIDTQSTYDEIKYHINYLRPEFNDRIELYNDSTPLFTHYKLENQISDSYGRECTLPSGGVIVIDKTEALISIDVNSAKATKGGDIEQTALQTNLEAADEIARQLRLRDLGGLIVIDFIDMLSTDHQKQVENKLFQAVRPDRARTQLSRISRFGLLEMSRQRLRSALDHNTVLTCPRCNGYGSIQDLETNTLRILRTIQQEISRKKTNFLQVQLPTVTCAYLMNEKKHAILEFETQYKTRILLIPNQNIEMPDFKIQNKNNMPEYEPDYVHLSIHKDQAIEALQEQAIERALNKPQDAVVNHSLDVQNKPASRTENALINWFKSHFASSEPIKTKPKQNRNQRRSSSSRSQQSGSRRSGGQTRNRRRPSNRSGGSDKNTTKSIERPTKTEDKTKAEEQ